MTPPTPYQLDLLICLTYVGGLLTGMLFMWLDQPHRP